jgi:hypothetical protein
MEELKMLSNIFKLYKSLVSYRAFIKEIEYRTGLAYAGSGCMVIRGTGEACTDVEVFNLLFRGV